MNTKIQIIEVPAGLTSPLLKVKIIEVDGKKFMAVEDFRNMLGKTSCVIDLSRFFSSLVHERKHDMGSMLLGVVRHAIKLATGDAAKTPFNIASPSDIALLELTMTPVGQVADEGDVAPCDCPDCVRKREAEQASQSQRN